MAEIYALLDPRYPTPALAVRYVGRAAGRATKRLREHLRDAETGSRRHSSCWIRRLRRLGFLPTLLVLEVVPTADAPARERAWIAHHRQLGCQLTNHTDGGEGLEGFHHRPESIDKMRERRRGRPLSPERRARIAAGLRGAYAEGRRARPGRTRPWSAEQRAMLSARARGRTLSDATRAKIAASLRGRRQPEAVNEKRRNTVRAYWDAHPEKREECRRRHSTEVQARNGRLGALARWGK